jgi:phosphatidylserine/phosphatidylglycerophosphate/cardiolipin synthase-like enzyme
VAEVRSFHEAEEVLRLCCILFLFAWSSLAATEVYFSPGDQPTAAVVRELGQVKSNLLVQAYSFTSAPIAKAVVDAHRRGVVVTVILDKSQRTEKYSSATFLVNQGVPTFIDAKHAIAHSKIMILDGHKVITGSFNFTKAAEEKNAENLLVIEDVALAQKYTRNWQAHATHAEKYQARKSTLPRGR